MSPLEQALADYLQLRRSLGHDLAEAGWLLPSFVAYLDGQGLRSVTVEAALTWAQHSATGKGLSVAPRRMTAARGFARYLSGIDPNTEVPPPLPAQPPQIPDPDLPRTVPDPDLPPQRPDPDLPPVSEEPPPTP